VITIVTDKLRKQWLRGLLWYILKSKCIDRQLAQTILLTIL